MLIHASTVAIDNIAIMLVGDAGTGKSDLDLRLIDEGASLIADDQTFLMRDGDRLVASAPDTIKGLIEVRHVGLLRMPYVTAATVGLFIELTGLHEELERLPEENFIEMLEVRVQCLRLPAFAASTPAKIRAALKYPKIT